MTTFASLADAAHLRADTGKAQPTTLYDLMSSLQDQFGPEDEDTVNAVVINFLSPGQLTFSGRWPEVIEA